MRKSHAIFLIAAVWSLLLHVIVLGLTGRVGWASRAAALVDPDKKPERIVKLIPDDPPPPPPPPPEERFGEKEDRGQAINELDAPEPAQSREAETEQAMLSRDPAGENGEREAPQAPVEPQPVEPNPSDPTTVDRPPAPELLAAAPKPAEKPKVDQSDNPITPSETEAPDPDESSETLASAPVAPMIAEQVEESKPEAKPAEPTKAPGDPAPESDRDSDAFGPAAAVELRAGKVSARAGRQFKFARPQHNLAGYVDAATINFPATIHLSVEIDQSGSPRRVIVTRSSGSPSIDRAIELAAYESWFEPVKAKTNSTGREQFDFGIILH